MHAAANRKISSEYLVTPEASIRPISTGSVENKHIEDFTYSVKQITIGKFLMAAAN
jgi:hypothetical protein